MSRTDQKVLAAVVPYEAIAMISTVEFDDQPLGWVVEIRSAQETAIGIANIYLDLRSWQPGLKQQPSEPCFHGRFRRLGEPGELA